jgi:hypothetical protein
MHANTQGKIILKLISEKQGNECLDLIHVVHFSFRDCSETLATTHLKKHTALNPLRPWSTILIYKVSKTVPLRHADAKGKRRYSSYSFLTSTLDGVSGQRHAPAALYPRERTPGTNWTGGWVDFRAGLDTEARGKIPCPCRGSNPVRPVC